ncbi:MAG: RDD family protein [Alphaproteobacteria bacterium]
MTNLSTNVLWHKNLQPDLFHGVLIRRIIAYFIDVFLIFWIVLLAKIGVAIVSVLSFFILTPLLIAFLALIPLGYHTFTIAGRHAATPGMQLMRIQVYDYTRGCPPTLIQALITTVIFYVTVPATGGLILLWPLLHVQSRTLHDILANTIILPRQS